MIEEKEILEGLNPEQARAVTHGDGPMLVVAGAGTGKTAVLVKRTAWLIATKRAKPDQVLALTFSEKAAAEMEERVDRLVPYGYAPMSIMTFHAFGDRLLKEHSLRLGLSPDAQVLAGAGLRVFLKERLFKLPLKRFRPLARPDTHVEQLLRLFSRAKDEGVSPEMYLKAAQQLALAHPEPKDDPLAFEDALDQMELAGAYAAFDEMLHREGFLDYGDQVALSLRLLQEHAGVLQKVRETYSHVLVDEFQDTNTAQFEILKCLCPSGQRDNLTVVGDDDQAIYRFRGASLVNILNFRQCYPQAEAVVLNRNYRSPQEVLDTAYRLIQFNNPERLEARESLDKKPVAAAERKIGQSVFFAPFDRAGSEADFLAAHIRKEIEAKRRKLGDFAVLVRSNAQAKPVLEALRYRGLPFRFTGARGLYQLKEVRLCLSFLFALVDPEDDLSLYDLLTGEIYRAPVSDLAALLKAARHRHRSLFSLLTRTDLGRDGEETDLDPEAWDCVSKGLADLEKYRQMGAASGAAEILYGFLEDSGWLKRMARQAGEEGELKLKNLSALFDRLKEYDRLEGPGRLNRLVDYLKQLIEEGDDPSSAEAELDDEAVTVSTVHSAKGLEWPVVFMTGLEENHFPSVGKAEAFGLPESLFPTGTDARAAHRAEERRLFYVGLTRAREECRLSYSRDHGGKRLWKRSGFLQEALNIPKEEPEPQRLSAGERLARHAAVPEPAGAALAAPLAPDAMLKLSYYRIDDYLTCPFKYRYIHLLNLRAPLSHSIVYGQAMHHAIQAYHVARMQGLAFGLVEMKAAFREAWRAEGFYSREHEEERLANGEKRLEIFYEEEEKLRQPPFWVEKPFLVSFGPNNLLEGRLDRLDRDKDGRVTICDYKTSNVHDMEKAQAEVKKSLQLAIYALGFQALEGRLPDSLRLYFLESGLKAELKPDEKYMEKKKAEIEEAIAGIRAADFRPKPDYMTCRQCHFSRICPATAVE